MRQEINLYTDEFIPSIKWCSFSNAVLVSSLCIVLAGFYSFNLYQDYQSLSEENIAWIEKTKGLEGDSSSDDLMDKIIEKRELLEKQVSKLSKEVANKKTIKGVYETEKNIRLASFHDVFLSIAKKSSGDLSVSEIGIYNGGEEVIVNGLSRTREAIPIYFKDLKEESSFSMTNFGLLKITRIENSGLYEFLMSRKNSLKNIINTDDKVKGGDAINTVIRNKGS
ncbi:MAG: hypothetical protein ACRBBR_10145 [Cellvibrionaceae bacterium]